MNPSHQISFFCICRIFFREMTFLPRPSFFGGPFLGFHHRRWGKFKILSLGWVRDSNFWHGERGKSVKAYLQVNIWDSQLLSPDIDFSPTWVVFLHHGCHLTSVSGESKAKSSMYRPLRCIKDTLGPDFVVFDGFGRTNTVALPPSSATARRWLILVSY
jgi:hypothetical protein